MAQPSIVLSEEPREARILEGAASLLRAATGASYIYDANSSEVIGEPQLKHLSEAGHDTLNDAWPKTLYYVHPGDNTFTPETGCGSLVAGDFLVTAAVRVETPELPWETGYLALPRYQLRMVKDIYRAINGQEIEGATVFIANRNLALEVDGWAIVQVQVSFEYTEPVQGEVV